MVWSVLLMMMMFVVCRSFVLRDCSLQFCVNVPHPALWFRYMYSLYLYLFTHAHTHALMNVNRELSECKNLKHTFHCSHRDTRTVHSISQNSASNFVSRIDKFSAAVCCFSWEMSMHLFPWAHFQLNWNDKRACQWLAAR